MYSSPKGMVSFVVVISMDIYSLREKEMKL